MKSKTGGPLPRPAGQAQGQGALAGEEDGQPVSGAAQARQDSIEERSWSDSRASGPVGLGMLALVDIACGSWVHCEAEEDGNNNPRPGGKG